MSIKRLITIKVEQTSPPTMDAVVFANDIKTALAGLGGTVVVTEITAVEHDVVLVEQESFLSQFQIEV
jgi:hypothetical protein